MSRGGARLPFDERGSVLMLGVGLVVTCVLAVTALVDVSAALLQRQMLLALADGAALAGAQAIDLSAYYAEGASPATRLDPAAVTPAVRRHLDATGSAASIEGLTIDRIWSDGRQVVVGLSSPLRLPFLAGLFPGEVRVESWAQLDYREHRDQA